MTRLPVACRSCAANGLETVLSLGRMPLANALLTQDQLGEPEETYPLELAFCPRCTLAQITETVPPEKLFRNYLYFSSFSDTVLCHSAALVERIIRDRRLGASHQVVEIASNDGYLLQFYRRAGIPVLGIEPARNIAQVARGKGIRTLEEFFSRDVAARLRAQGERADVIHANNVLAHVADLNGFVAGLTELLTPGGVAVLEMPYVADMVAGVEFDTIYHEHLCYFSLTALVKLFERHGLTIHHVERLPIHGGSLRVFAGHTEEQATAQPSVMTLLDREQNDGVTRAEFFRDFGARVLALREELVGLLARLKSQGSRIAAYGASAKGSTLLNFFGIGRETLDFVVDRSTAKQGRFTPGTHLPILPPEQLLKAQPGYVLLLTWNFAEEIFEQQAEFRRRGGKFIIPIPKVRVA